MFGRSALASASAAASLAAILFAATDCKVQVGSAAQASPAGPVRDRQTSPRLGTIDSRRRGDGGGLSSQGEGAAVPVGLDPRVASSAHPDLQDVGHPARRRAEPYFQAVRVRRVETRQPRRRHRGRVHVRRCPPAAHPRVSRPDPQLPAPPADELPRLSAHIHPHGILQARSRPDRTCTYPATHPAIHAIGPASSKDWRPRRNRRRTAGARAAGPARCPGRSARYRC